jgi:8-oxo-dGTP pyrophosphatase MutT (NUDIX family)
MSKIPTKTQTSAGGIAFRSSRKGIQVALISVGEENRWQLPKGLIEKGEKPETAAVREVREEAGIETTIVDLIDKIDYWYFALERKKRVRYHKYVYFFLLHYDSGNVSSHDHEVNEARWFDADEAIERLAFSSEKQVMQKARKMISAWVEPDAPDVTA